MKQRATILHLVDPETPYFGTVIVPFLIENDISLTKISICRLSRTQAEAYTALRKADMGTATDADLRKHAAIVMVVEGEDCLTKLSAAPQMSMATAPVIVMVSKDPDGAAREEAALELSDAARTKRQNRQIKSAMLLVMAGFAVLAGVTSLALGFSLGSGGYSPIPLVALIELAGLIGLAGLSLGILQCIATLYDGLQLIAHDRAMDEIRANFTKGQFWQSFERFIQEIEGSAPKHTLH